MEQKDEEIIVRSPDRKVSQVIYIYRNDKNVSLEELENGVRQQEEITVDFEVSEGTKAFKQHHASIFGESDVALMNKSTEKQDVLQNFSDLLHTYN